MPWPGCGARRRGSGRAARSGSAFRGGETRTCRASPRSWRKGDEPAGARPGRRGADAMTETAGTRIEAAFARAAREKRAVVIPYITAGYPALDETVGLVLAAAEAGADLVEIGLPFSDPLADGPVIQAASQKALENGVTLHRALGMASEVRRSCPIPIVLMGYYNPLLRFGIAAFMKAAAESGVDGLIVPDMPFEESLEVREAARTQGVALTFLVAPTTPEDRLSVLDAVSTGFLYCVSVTGVTGPRTEFDPG